MLSYKKQKQLNKIKNNCVNVLLFPLRCICTPIYELKEKYDKNKRYSYKQIKKLLMFAINNHLDSEHIKSIYIVLDDYAHSLEDGNDVFSYYSLYDCMSHNHIKIKNKLRHIYKYQKDYYVEILKMICPLPMTDEEKLIDFGMKYNDKIVPTSFYQKVKNKDVCKIKNK